MSSDRARVTFDDQQQYRSVVMQQGRVTLEADWNEAQQILNEEMRKEALDFVGPTGTPDDGYKIGFPSAANVPFDFAIAAGTMYVGGLRVALSQPTTYTTQPDWLGATLPTLTPPVREHIVLHLVEQEVGAVEDGTLREVALGGPDTGQRTRLIQRVVREKTAAQDCDGALKEAVQAWRAAGLDLDPTTMRLLPQASLQVSFSNVLVNPDPCEPAAQGGYLGAENQLIRVQVSDAANKKIVWGYDNASFLYRIDPAGSTTLTLKLMSRPVDAFHQPRPNQAVEALPATARMHNGEYIAAGGGQTRTLTAAYNPDARTITLPSAVPADYLDTTKTPRLFLRVWEQELTFTPGQPLPLGTTGVEVTLQVSTGGLFHTGDFWLFAVRPSTSTQIYPPRYLQAAQPPDGPRHWVCPLAVIAWDTNNVGSLLEDCREKFDNLVELTKHEGGCCTFTLEPGDDIQDALDRLPPEGGCVCLKTGLHVIQEPLEIKRPNVTLEGESPGTRVQRQGGIAVLRIRHPQGAVVSDVRVEGIRFEGGGAAGADAVVAISNGRNVVIRRCGLSAGGTIPIGVMYDGDTGDTTIADNRTSGLAVGVYAQGGGALRCTGNVFTNPRMRLASMNLSFGLGGIQLGDGVFGACEITDNTFDHYWIGVQVGGRAEETVVARNRIRRAPLPASLATTSTDLAFAIDVAAPHCLVADNWIELNDPLYGGIRVKGLTTLFRPSEDTVGTRVERNEIRSFVVAGNQLLPSGIVAELATTDAPLDVVIAGNVLTGAQNAIAVNGNIVMLTRGVQVLDNRIEALAGGASSAFRGILLKYARDAIVARNELAGVPLGIGLTGGQNNQVLENHVTDGQAAIYAQTETGLQVSGNVTAGMTLAALWAQAVEQARFAGNRSGGPGGGILVFEGDGNEFCANVLTSGLGGIALDNETRPHLIGNVIEDMRFAGIVAHLTSDLVLKGNRLTWCGYTRSTGTQANTAYGIRVDANHGSLTIESCEVRHIGRSPDGKTVVPVTVRAIEATSVEDCQVRDNLIVTASGLAAGMNHRSLFLLPSTIARHGAQVLDNTVVGTLVAPLIEVSLMVTTGFRFRVFRDVLFSNNRCDQTRDPSSTSVGPDPTVILAGHHLSVVGNQITADLRPHPSFDFMNSDYLTAVGNITSGDWNRLGAQVKPTPPANFNHINVP